MKLLNYITIGNCVSAMKVLFKLKNVIQILLMKEFQGLVLTRYYCLIGWDPGYIPVCRSKAHIAAFIAAYCIFAAS